VAYPSGIKGFISQNLPKLDLPTDAEYVANLVNVGRATVCLLHGFAVLYLHNDIFLTDIEGYDRLKLS